MERMIVTSHGVINRDAVIRDRILLDNDNEKTLNLEYRLKTPMRMPDGQIVLPDEIIKRSAHVRLKQWPSMTLSAADLMEALKPGTKTSFRPSHGDPVKAWLRRMGHAIRFANTQAMCTSFKKEVLCGSHAFGTQAANGVRTVTTKDAFKMALYLASATINASTTAYSATGELAASGNYTAGGNSVTNGTDPSTSGTTAFWTPTASVSWANLTSSGSFDAALLYNDTSTGDLAVAVFTFGAQSVTAGTFTLTMPTNDATNALIRIA